MLNDLQWQALQEGRAHSKVIMLYRIVNHLVTVPASPPYLLLPSSDTTRGHQSQFTQQHCRIQAYQHSFFSSVVCLWNALPASVVSAQSLEVFKKPTQAAVPLLIWLWPFLLAPLQSSAPSLVCTRHKFVLTSRTSHISAPHTVRQYSEVKRICIGPGKKKDLDFSWQKPWGNFLKTVISGDFIPEHKNREKRGNFTKSVILWKTEEFHKIRDLSWPKIKESFKRSAQWTRCGKNFNWKRRRN